MAAKKDPPKKEKNEKTETKNRRFTYQKNRKER